MPTSRRRSTRLILAKNLRVERTNRGWSQEELADRAGISQTYTSQVESGQRSVSIDILEGLARALGLQAHELLTPKH